MWSAGGESRGVPRSMASTKLRWLARKAASRRPGGAPVQVDGAVEAWLEAELDPGAVVADHVRAEPPDVAGHERRRAEQRPDQVDQVDAEVEQEHARDGGERDLAARLQAPGRRPVLLREHEVGHLADAGAADLPGRSGGEELPGDGV